MTNNNHSAFTLIEIMIVVAIIGLIGAMVLPRMVKRAPSSEWSHVQAELNNAIYFARQQAISNQKNYRVVFQAPPQADHSVVVEVEGPDPEKPGMLKFAPTKSEYFEGEYKLPESITIHAVWQGKVEQLAENKNKAYCYVIPNGLVQDVMVHMRRFASNKESKVSFIIEPFFGKFTMSEGYVKPGR